MQRGECRGKSSSKFGVHLPIAGCREQLILRCEKNRSSSFSTDSGLHNNVFFCPGSCLEISVQKYYFFLVIFYPQDG